MDQKNIAAKVKKKHNFLRKWTTLQTTGFDTQFEIDKNEICYV